MLFSALHASSILSTLPAPRLSFTIVVQCMPEVRDWLWYRHLGDNKKDFIVEVRRGGVCDIYIYVAETFRVYFTAGSSFSSSAIIIIILILL